MAIPLQLLVLEDRPEDVELMLYELRQAGFEPDWQRVENRADYLARLGTPVDVILADFTLPQFDALQALRLLQEADLEIPFIIVSGAISEEVAVACIKQGASDYLLKDRLARLGEAVKHALEQKRLHDEKRAAEAALRESEARYRRLAEHAQDIIYRLRLAPNRAFDYISPAVATILGYAPEEFYERPALWHELATVDGRNDSQFNLEQATKPIVTRFTRRDGATVWLEQQTVTIGGEDGRPVAVEGIARDITERKNAEDALLASKRQLEQTLAKLNDTQRQNLQQERLAAVGELAAGIAHDFNNILAAIVLYSELLLRSAILPDKGRQWVETILKQAQRGTTLIRQILDFSRRGVLEPHPMDLASLVHEVAGLLTHMLPDTIRVRVDHADEAYVVNADPARIQQVFMNLAVNARDAMPSGGELIFQLALVQTRPGAETPPTDLPPGNWVNITVSDTGSGISPESLSHVFEPFYSTKAPGQGTGLGLAQVYGIVKQHNGHIDVESLEGQGTTFRIYLPELAVLHAAEPDMAVGSVTAIASAAVRGEGETILVVEDDAATQRAVSDALQTLNYRVLLASDGQEALQVFEKQAAAIDLVICDLMMPHMDGLALRDALQARYPGTRMIMMTGYRSIEDGREQLSTGIVAWLDKPISSETLAQRVREALLSRQ